MLSRLTRSLFLTSRAFYSTQQKVNIVHVPRSYELTFGQSSTLQSQIDISPTCKTLAVLIKENLELFSDHHIGAVFNQIGRYELVVDNHFHTVIAPIAIEWVKTFTRDQAPALQSIILTLTSCNIESPQLQQAVVKKLDEENIYRYIDLTGTVAVFLALSKHKRFHDHSLFQKIQNVIYQQKNYYSHKPALLKAIREGMEAVEVSGQKPLEIQQAFKQLSQ